MFKSIYNYISKFLIFRIDFENYNYSNIYSNIDKISNSRMIHWKYINKMLTVNYITFCRNE